MMTSIEEGQIQIHTENIFPIIKKAVYSDHEIFLRELISNGVDAINKLKMASMAGDCEPEDEPKIEIKLNRDENTISISDNGIGMTSEEVKKYINQVAFSSAEEFIQKYDKDNEQIIGHFGLGFYSSFMVSKKVELITKSALKDSIPIKWSCDGSPNFTIEQTIKDKQGTEVKLFLLDEENEYIEPSRIKTLITKYCDYMPIKILLDGELINKMNPPWRKNSKELTDQEYKDFYQYLYPFQGDPLFWIHLNTDYPYNLQGILFFPKITGRADWESGQIKLYSNQVFVSDTIKEVVPNYLTPLRGILDSTDIPLNVSRSALQSDRRVKSIGNFVSKKIADKLKLIKKDDPEFYGNIWDSISPFIKIGAMEDDKFAEQVENLIVFRTNKLSNKSTVTEENTTNEGKNKENYTTIKEYLERTKNNKIIYCTDEISQGTALNIWESKGVEIIKADTVIDTQFISWLESKNSEVTFQRVDSEIEDNVDNSDSNITDHQGNTESENIRNLFKNSLANDRITIKVNSLEGENIPPCIILLPEQMRRINDIGALMEQRLPGLPDNHVLLVNKNNSLIKGLLKLNGGSILLDEKSNSPSQQLAIDLAKHLYQMAISGIGGLEASQISEFHAKSAHIMAKLLDLAL